MNENEHEFIPNVILKDFVGGGFFEIYQPFTM